MTSITVSALYVYPIKSCAGIALQEAQLDARGIIHDRQWMIVADDDEERGLFFTQRELPDMARIRTAFDGGDLVIDAPKMNTLRVPLMQQAEALTLPVVVWNDTCVGVDEGDRAASWMSRYLDVPARLVRMDDSFVRQVDPGYARTPAQTGFSDGFPLLLLSEESVSDLNQRLAARGHGPLPVDRFRPNLVVTGGGPYAEDTWTNITIGDIPLEVVKACARCAITTVDQSSGTIPNRDEPLATLATYRRGTRGVLFGQNVIHRAYGSVRQGDVLTPTGGSAR